MSSSQSEIGELSFEEAFHELEGIVSQLESGELPLEEALAAFEKGQALAQRGQKLLEEAELKLTELQPDVAGPDDEASE